MKFTVGRKLYAGFLAVTLLLALISWVGYAQMAFVDKVYTNFLDDRVKQMLLIKDMNSTMNYQQVTARGYLLLATEKQLEEYNSAKQEYSKITAELEKMMKFPKGKEYFHSLERLAISYDNNVQEAFALKDQNDEGYLGVMKTKMAPQVEAYYKLSGEFMKFQQDLLMKEKEEIEQRVATVKLIILSVSIFAVVLAVAIAFFIGRAITKPILQVNSQLKEIAEGEADLTKEITIKSKDELGDLAHYFNQMIANLRTLIRQVAVTTEQVAASSEQLNASAEETSNATEHITSVIQDVASGIEKQVKNTTESANSIQDMATGIQSISKNAQQVSNSMDHSTELANNGNQSVRQAIQQMNAISDTVEELSHSVRNLGARSNEIGNIVEVISGIAAQTNLLSLNAAIEAARAGEHGKGFAVVADEVRKLAEQSAHSAKQITDLVEAIQSETEKTVSSMIDASSRVSQGIEVVNETGESFGKIVGSMSDVSLQIEEVSAAVEQLAAGAEQIVQSINEVTKISNESATGAGSVASASEEQLASMQEITASATSLSKIAEDLQVLVNRFRV